MAKAQAGKAPKAPKGTLRNIAAKANVVDAGASEAVDSPSTASDTAITPNSTQPAEAAKDGQKYMQLSLKGLDKRGRNAIYTGGAVSVRIPVGFFKDKQAPESFGVDGEALAGPKVAKAKLTPEERKAARANAPKLTLAEKVQRAEERAAALKAKLEKANAAS